MRNFITTAIMAAALSLGATGAQAMPVTHNVSLTVDSPAILDIPINSPILGPGTLSLYDNPVYTGFPLTFADGDTIELDVIVNGPGLVLNTSAPGIFEILTGINYGVSDIPFDQPTDNPGLLPMLSYDRTTTVSVTNFTGSLANSTIVSSALGVTSTSPVFSQSSGGNYTDSTVTLTEFTIATTFTNITFLPGFETYAGFTAIAPGASSLIAAHEFAGVPVPGALSLIGVGLLSLVSLRRKAA